MARVDTVGQLRLYDPSPSGRRVARTLSLGSNHINIREAGLGLFACKVFRAVPTGTDVSVGWICCR